MYESYNKFLRVSHSEAHQGRLAETQTRMEEVIEERTKTLNHEEGETISWDDYQDIYCQVKGEERVKYNFELNTKDKNGDIADYLEVRRPFGAAA